MKLWQRDQNSYIIYWEEASFSLKRALKPIIVHLLFEVDPVPLLEAQLSRVLRLEVVQCLTCRLAKSCGS